MDTLDGFRREIDILDARIIEAISQRFEICRKIALLKKEQFIPMMQHGRIEEVRQHCAELCARYGVSIMLVDEIYRLIISESCQMEDEIIDNADSTSATIPTIH